MKPSVFARLVCLTSVHILAGCGLTDSFAPRIATASDNYQEADVQNILANIMRAGFSEPVNHVIAGQYSGEHNAGGNIGLPTITIGPAQSVSQRQFVFGGNGIDSSVKTGIQATHVRTSEFAQDMMAQINTSQIGSFIGAGFSPELVLNLFVENIRVSTKGRDDAVVLRNDPTLDEIGCPADPSLSSEISLNIVRGSPYYPASVNYPQGCEYSKFRFYLLGALRLGLRTERAISPSAVPVPPSGRTTRDVPALSRLRQPQQGASDQPQPTKQNDAPSSSEDRFCFDPAFASASRRATLLQTAQGFLCGKSRDALSTRNNELDINFGAGLTQTVQIQLRSPQNIFRYLGRIARARPATTVTLYSTRDPLVQNYDIFNVVHKTSGCFAHTVHRGISYCVPEEFEYSKMSISILSRLVQLNTNRQDVPASPVLVGFGAR